MTNHGQSFSAFELRSTGSSADSTPPTDIHDLLRTPRRWYVVEYLARANAPADFNDVVDYVAERLNADRKSVRNTLYQTHLPKLQKADVVDYERASGMIEPGDRIADVTSYMRGVDASPGFMNRLRNWISSR